MIAMTRVTNDVVTDNQRAAPSASGRLAVANGSTATARMSNATVGIPMKAPTLIAAVIGVQRGMPGVMVFVADHGATDIGQLCG